MWHYMHSLSKNLHFLSRWSVLQFGKVTFPLPWCVWQKYQKQRSFWKNEIITKTETKWRKVEYVYNITVYISFSNFWIWCVPTLCFSWWQQDDLFYFQAQHKHLSHNFLVGDWGQTLGNSWPILKNNHEK